MTRDIPFDEECPERSDDYREQVGEPCSLADLEEARRRWVKRFAMNTRAQFFAAELLARREGMYRAALERDGSEKSPASGKALDEA